MKTPFISYVTSYVTIAVCTFNVAISVGILNYLFCFSPQGYAYALISTRAMHINHKLVQNCGPHSISINFCHRMTIGSSSKIKRKRSSFEDIKSMTFIYHRLYGANATIPSSFIVPDDNPDWPKDFAGVALGRKLKDIKRGKSYTSKVSNSPDTVSLMFSSSVKSKEDIFLENLCFYRDSVIALAPLSHFTVPFSYIMPSCPDNPDRNCYKLGVAYNYYVKKALRHLSSPMTSSNAKDANLVYRLQLSGVNLTALLEEPTNEIASKYYDKQTQDNKKIVPRNVRTRVGIENLDFTSSHGLNMEDIMDIDDDSNLIIDEQLPQSNSLPASFLDILAILKVHKSIHGHLHIPQSWRVPHEHPWPSNMWGRPVGRKLNSMRSRASRYRNNPLFRQPLEELGFIWCMNDYKFEKLFASLKWYHQLYGHLVVPTDFMVPRSESIAQWPSDMCGYPLGFVWHRVRLGRLFSTTAYRSQLMSAGLWPTSTIPQSQLGLIDSASNATSGILGSDAGSLISSQVLKHASLSPSVLRLNAAMGLSAPSTSSESLLSEVLAQFPSDIDCIITALSTYKTLYKDLLKIPYYFKVPLTPSTASHDASAGADALKSTATSSKFHSQQRLVSMWPPQVRGLKLGVLMRRLRSLKKAAALPIDLSERLLEAGLVLSQSDYKFVAFMDALMAFRSLHGSFEVPSDFVVPLGMGWPAYSVGLKLGNLLMKTQNGKAFLDPEHQRILANARVPLENYRDRQFATILSALQWHYRLFGDMDVPRYFVVPSEPPWPEATWGMNLGSRYRNIKSRGAYSERWKLIENKSQEPWTA